jgi:hypothetical protein
MAKLFYANNGTTYLIPTSLSREVGRIVVRWAFLEHTLQQIVWLLMQVSFPYGRIAVREPRLEDRIQIIKTLAELRGIEFDEATVSRLQEDGKLTARSRDVLAHGMWSCINGTWHVMLTRGKWSEDFPHPSSKSVVPEALIVTTQALRAISADIERLIGYGHALLDHAQTILPIPPEVHPELLPRKTSKRSRNPSKLERQPRS